MSEEGSMSQIMLKYRKKLNELRKFKSHNKGASKTSPSLNSENNSDKTKTNFKYRTLNLGSYKMFFTIENQKLIYKFI